MSRTIDADALIPDFLVPSYTNREPCKEYVSMEQIHNAPTIEPERKVGKWIPVTNGRGGHECDQCHEYAPSFESGNEYLSRFCPNCGCYNGGENEI